MERGRNFEGFSLPSQAQAGGVLWWHWRVCQFFGADEWIIAVLQHGYRMPFRHLLPVSLETQEFPSCSLGSARALALRVEVDKVLQKETLQAVDQLGPGFYSRLLLVEKVTGAGGPLSTCRLSTSLSH